MEAVCLYREDLIVMMTRRPIPHVRPALAVVAVVCVVAAHLQAAPPPGVPPSSATMDGQIAPHGPLVIGGGDGFEPFHYLDDGQPAGFDVDLVRAIARVMDLEVEVRLDYWEDVRAGLDDGSIDAHIGMTHSPDRADRFRFSTPYLTQQYKIFIVESNHAIHERDDLPGKRIIVQKDGVMEEYVAKRLPTATAVPAASAAEALRMLALGEGDCCLMTEFRGLTVARDLGLDQIVRVGRPVYQTTYGFAVPAGGEDLVLALNQGLALLKQSGEYARIYEDWFGVLAAPRPSPRDYLRVLGWIVGPLLAAFLVAALWTWSLRSQVIRQTAELRLARDQAQAASRAKSRFLATISHEIRTPLNGVLGMVQLLLAGDGDPAQSEQLTTVQRSALRLQDIINDMLEFSRIDAGQRTLETVEFSPRALIDEVLATVAPEASARGISLQAEIDDELPRLVRGDPTAVRQVLLGLLDNGVKFTHAGSVTLELAARPTGDRTVRLEGVVVDTGIGVPEAERGRLFDAFEQADSSSTRRYGGTGLGLAIGMHLVRLMDGDLAYEPGEAGGSRFRFAMSLDAVADSEGERSGAEVAQEVSDVEAADQTHAPVLVVEDNPTNQRVVCLLLKKWGLTSEVAENGREAVAAVGRRDFSAVIMDCQMPVMDGLEATERIRALETDDVHVPIIALTAGADLSTRENCLAAGMDDYLKKPVHAPSLRQALMRCLEARGAREPVGV
ncbi:transporter substrate-binding domain-containing protein [bacterium]|nr:transporter substrate-binding domain-containing protein [bacterium]